MKIGGKNGLTKAQFRNLILNLQEVAHEIKAEKEKQENTEDKENEK